MQWYVGYWMRGELATSIGARLALTPIQIMIADKQLNIEWREVPHPASGNGDDVHLPRAAVLATADLLTNENGLLVLITGKGGPRAGIWGRQLCIADSLEHGSAWTMMHAAVSRGWAVLAFDPNRNTDDDGRKIPGSKTPEEHCVTAWRAFVTGVSNGPAGPSPARQIGVIAHSAGGGWLISCLQPQHTPDDQLHRIRGLAFTDSIHTMARRKLDDARFEILSKRACQWRAGPGKLDDPMVDDRAPAGQLELGCGCECRRAGTEDHASTNFMAEKSIFKFLDFHMDHEFVPPTPMDAPSCSFEFDDPDDSDSSDDDRRRGR